MDWSIFRAYDVRGIFPDEIDENAFYRIAQGYTYIFKPESIVVGMDARLSSPQLKKGLVAGFLDAGVDVIDIGGITTDMLYYTVGAHGYSGGVIVTASHNPKEYNGMKMVREKATAISSDTGLFEIRDALKLDKDKEVLAEVKGAYSQIDIMERYVNHVLSFIDKSSIQRFKIVANANFGFVCRPVEIIVRELNLNTIRLNFEPDGSFPKGPPDPMLPDNRRETEGLIKSSGADFGVAWDADADRVMFFDEKGEFVSGAYITALLAEIMLRKYGENNKIIFDPRVIWPIKQVVESLNGQPIISKGGHAFMKDRMRSENALFAGEMSAHYYFRDNYYADNGVIPFLLVLEHLSTRNKKFSEIMEQFYKGHYMSGELNYRVKDVATVIEAVKERFGGAGKEDYTDGFSLDHNGWRFNIRPSNTEPLLRLNIEAKQEGKVERIREEIEELIQKVSV
jgi:phosphomannomutase